MYPPFSVGDVHAGVFYLIREEYCTSLENVAVCSGHTTEVTSSVERGRAYG